MTLKTISGDDLPSAWRALVVRTDPTYGALARALQVISVATGCPSYSDTRHWYGWQSGKRAIPEAVQRIMREALLRDWLGPDAPAVLAALSPPLPDRWDSPQTAEKIVKGAAKKLGVII